MAERAGGGGGLLYLPWLFVAAATLTGYGGNGTSQARGVRCKARGGSAFGVGTTFLVGPLFWTAVALLLLRIGMWRLARRVTPSAAAVFLLPTWACRWQPPG
ncbi:MAG: hypothetical protein R2854_19205 [Caldilineaceae bacterium]